MSLLIYNISLWLYKTGIRFASLFNQKAAKWISGRKNLFRELASSIQPGEKIIWMHCASLGEFEQGRPLLEKLRETCPAYRVLLSFFSPSGFEVRKEYSQADWVVYLPLDSARNARRLLDITQPALAIFVKYEYWYYYLRELKKRKIPVLLVSALFRKDSSFFKWYGSLQRKMLGFFDHLFVQNEKSRLLLAYLGLKEHITVSGDTRFDRVVQIAGMQKELPAIAAFANNTTIVAGSTWREDELILQKILSETRIPALRMIIAPHEISDRHLRDLRSLFAGSVFYSEWENNRSSTILPGVLIMDNIGLLAHIYKYGFLTYVGGGFKTGLHNVLEAAVHNKIVFFGPLYKKHYEAAGLAKSGGGIPVTSEQELLAWVNKFLSDETDRENRSRLAGEFVRSNTGATKKIMNHIQEKRLLTS